MLVVFSPIFVADIKLTFANNFVAPLIMSYIDVIFSKKFNFGSLGRLFDRNRYWSPETIKSSYFSILPIILFACILLPVCFYFTGSVVYLFHILITSPRISCFLGNHVIILLCYCDLQGKRFRDPFNVHCCFFNVFYEYYRNRLS